MRLDERDQASLVLWAAECVAAHVTGHAAHAANYAVTVTAAVSADPAAAEKRGWRLPERLRPVVFPAR